MSFLVHAAGTQSLLVDLGRPRTRSLGMPVGGAADRTAFQLGNALVGNDPYSVALEFTLAGPTLQATEQHACAIAGANFDIWLNERALPAWKTFNVAAGDMLAIGAVRKGLRGYLAVRGGIQSPEILGSQSALEAIRTDATLECAPGWMTPRFVRLDDLPSPTADGRTILRVLRGSHWPLFHNPAFVEQVYRVSPNSNRMGLRLAGTPLSRDAVELLSAPVCPGTVQITNDGQPIILGVDAQTIGGYPRIAHVIVPDLDKLAQLPPGADVQFQWVELADAVAIQQEREQWLHEWLVRLRVSSDGLR